MYCTQCGNKLVENAKFCNQCGTAIKVDFMKTESVEKRKELYDGVIHKCPNCGEVIGAYELVCKSCGYELRDSKSTNALIELQKNIARLESERKQKNSVDNILSMFSMSPDSIDNIIASYIKNFPIPNNKEDIFEFLILAVSNINPDGYDKMGKTQGEAEGQRLINDAWDSKYNQAFQKAKLTFSDDSRLVEIANIYNEKSKLSKKAKSREMKLLIGMMVGIVVMILFSFIMARLSI